jgi:hypothetical protein
MTMPVPRLSERSCRSGVGRRVDESDLGVAVYRTESTADSDGVRKCPIEER